MRRLAMIGLMSLCLVGAALPAAAGDGYGHKGQGHRGHHVQDYGHKYHYPYWARHHHKHRHHHGYHHRRHHRHGAARRYNGDDLLIGLAAFAGGVAVGSLLTTPADPAPPVAYHVVPSSHCVQDNVYRYLPDGRIQWGVRTSCY